MWYKREIQANVGVEETYVLCFLWGQISNLSGKRSAVSELYLFLIRIIMIMTI